MRHAFPTLFIALFTLAFAICTQNVLAQNPQTQTPSPGHSAGDEVGSGTGDIGKGAAKGTGAAAEGVGKGAGDLVTLHPVEAAGNVGKGAADTGKDVGVGAAKGTDKIAKGTGHGIGKIFHHHKKAAPSSNPQS